MPSGTRDSQRVIGAKLECWPGPAYQSDSSNSPGGAVLHVSLSDDAHEALRYAPESGALPAARSVKTTAGSPFQHRSP